MESAGDLVEDEDRAIAVLNAGGVDDHAQRQAFNIDEGMHFAVPSPSCRRRNPLRLFHSGSRLPFFRRFQRLAVEDRGGWAGFAVERFAQRHMEFFPDALPDAVTLELPEDVVDRRARRKRAARQIPAETARA